MHIEKPKEAVVDPLASLRAPISALRFSTSRYPGFGLLQVQDYRKPAPASPATDNGPLNTSLRNFTANDPGGPDRKGGTKEMTPGQLEFGYQANRALNSGPARAATAVLPGGFIAEIARQMTGGILASDRAKDFNASRGQGFTPNAAAGVVNAGYRPGDVTTEPVADLTPSGRMGPPGNESDQGGDLGPAGNGFGGGLGTGNSGAAEAAAAADAAAGEGNGSGGMGSAGMGDGTSEPGGRGGFAHGGPVTGDRLTGPNPPGPDDGQASLDIGEFVLNQGVAQQLGPDALAVINSGQFDAGAVRRALGLGAG